MLLDIIIEHYFGCGFELCEFLGKEKFVSVYAQGEVHHNRRIVYSTNCRRVMQCVDSRQMYRPKIESPLLGVNGVLYA